jgi:hypothetical protein
MNTLGTGILKKKPGKARRGRPDSGDAEVFGFRLYWARNKTPYDVFVEDLIAHDALSENPGFETRQEALAKVKLVRTLFRHRLSEYLNPQVAHKAQEEGKKALELTLYQENQEQIERVTGKLVAAHRDAVAEHADPLPEDRAVPFRTGEAKVPPFQEVMDLNKRLLHEIKQLRQDMQVLKSDVQSLKDQQSAFLTGLTANRPTVAPAPTTPAPASAPSNVVPNAPVKGPQAPQVAQRDAGPLGLVVAKPAPGTRPQEGAQRVKVVEPKEGMDIRAPERFGDAMAFDDMMKGR